MTLELLAIVWLLPSLITALIWIGIGRREFGNPPEMWDFAGWMWWVAGSVLYPVLYIRLLVSAIAKIKWWGFIKER